jgi:hypothetical protein
VTGGDFSSSDRYGSKADLGWRIGVALAATAIAVWISSGAPLFFTAFVAAVVCQYWYLTLVAWSYEVVLEADGLLEFHSALRHKKTTVDAVTAVEKRANEGDAWLKITYAGGRARVSTARSKDLVPRIQELNPSVKVVLSRRRSKKGPQAPPPAWYQDPFGRHQARYFDGTRWTERVADNGYQGLDSPDIAQGS